MASRPTPTPHPLTLLLVPVAVLALPLSLRSQDTPLIDTRSTSTGAVVDQEAIRNLPTSRDPWAVLATLPGVQAGQAGAASAVRGASLMSVDGIAIGDPADLGSSGTYTDFSTDAVQEIEVQTDGTQSEYGRSMGGVIQVLTKRGTNDWQGSGHFLGGSGGAFGIEGASDPGFQIEVQQGADGGYCMGAFQFLDGGAAIPGARGPGTETIRIGFDQGFPIGADPGSTTALGAGGGGNLNLFQLPPCPGTGLAMSFVDAPGPVTPPNPTHLFFGQNGVFAVDMGRIGSKYGMAGARRPEPYKLEDTHIFSSSFYLTGMSSYVNGGFQLVPQGGGVPAAGGSGNGFFLYGVDASGLQGLPTQTGARRDPYAIQLQSGTSTSAPDIDGDGKPDSFFLSFGSLQGACPNVLGSAFTAGSGGTGGGTLLPDAQAPKPDCVYLRDRVRFGEYFSLNLGVRADAFDREGGDASSLFESGGANRKPRISGAFQDSWGLTNRLGGPLVRDKLWFWGTYNLPRAQPSEKQPLFSAQSYRAPNVYELFANNPYTTGAIRSASAGRGVQDVGIEVRSGAGSTGARPADRYMPGGAVRGVAQAADSPLLYVVAQGGPTGDVFQVQIVHPESGSVAIDGIVAVEPVAATAADRQRFERELAGSGGARETVTAAGYCLQQDALAPPAGTVYRVASADKQARFAPMRRALDAARRLRDAGQLHPDSDPTDYYHSIRQWAVWTVEKGFDRQGFLDAFVERTEKNFRDAGQPWSDDIAAAVRSYGEGRWTDIRAILDAAEDSP